MQVYDGHCHLDAVSQIAAPKQVAVAAINLKEIEHLVNYRQLNPLAKIGIGIHPWQINDEFKLPLIRQQLLAAIEQQQPDFIGEFGLDKLKPQWLLQLQLCQLHLELAQQFKLPVVIHCVRGYNELLQLLTHTPVVRGLVHAYNANHQIAQQLWHKHIFIGIGSIILRHSSQLLKGLSELPLEQIIIESDATAILGTGNSSSDHCLHYAQRLAAILGQSLPQITLQLNHNWQQLFGN